MYNRFFVRKTCYLQEGQWSGGIGSLIIQSRVIESCFYALESTPCVIGALDTPVPFSPPLEKSHSSFTRTHNIDYQNFSR